MTCTGSKIAAASLALTIALMNAAPGAPREGVAPVAARASVELKATTPRLGGDGAFAERSVDALARSGTQRTERSALVAMPWDPRLSRTAQPLPFAPRPQLRAFAAEGPLLARLSDPTFGPRARPARALFRPQARPGDLLLPDPPRTLAGASDLLCIAVAIYHEARDQPLDGQLAVASVILNRARVPQRWGAGPCGVVVPVQFSFLSAGGHFPPIDDQEAWAVAVEMAREALLRGPSALVGQADHYHTPAVSPAWGDDMRRVIRIGDHIFYDDPMARG